MTLKKEDVIGHYKVISQLGAGGMGEVFLAEDTRLERKVALKLLPEKFSADSEPLNRFKQEAKAASALNHPNIITVYEIGETDGTNFIATEFIDGKTMGEFLQSGEKSHRISSPQSFKSGSGSSCIANRMGDVFVSEIVLDKPCVISLICQIITR